jgi:hypothetical protein
MEAERIIYHDKAKEQLVAGQKVGAALQAVIV